MMLMLNVPATIGLIVLAHPIVELLLEYHRFIPDDTTATAAALMFYAPGLVGYSAVKIASPSFYSMGDSRTPATRQRHEHRRESRAQPACSSASWGTGASRSARRSPRCSTPARCSTCSSRRLDGLDGRRIAVSFGKILVASVLMGAASYLAAEWLADVLPSRAWYWRAVRVSSAIGAGLLVLMGSARLLAHRRVQRRGEPRDQSFVRR